MAKPKEKSIAMMALGMPKPGGDAPDGDADGLSMAMQDFMDALDSKDASGMAAAFRHAADICQGGGEMGPAEDEG